MVNYEKMVSYEKFVSVRFTSEISDVPFISFEKSLENETVKGTYVMCLYERIDEIKKLLYNLKYLN